ncbi:MAG: hypothetical protein EP343_10700 [Deltaproteobacteria bacterium]|nr:MAG: hypothetical protein EP343_10700 [Deltaproteobacteria bacterium]
MRYNTLATMGMVLSLVLGWNSADAATDFRIVVVGAKLLPTKTGNRCWDPCMPSARTALSSLTKQLAVLSTGDAWSLTTNRQSSLLKGSKMPDPYLVIKFSNGKRIKTGVAKNTLSPQWGTTERVSLDKGDTVSFLMRDKDLNKDDTIGTKPNVSIPAHLLKKGGTWKLRFHKVYELELLLVKLKTKILRRFVPGLYRVTIRQAEIAKTKPSGSSWDVFRGRPDPFVILTLGKHRIVTPHKKNTHKPIWNYSKDVYLNGDERFEFLVFDRDLSSHDLIGSCFFNQLRFAPLFQRKHFRWNCKSVKDIRIDFARIK